MALRRDPRILKLPPYLSFAFVIVGIAWLLLLPLDNYCRKIYISENALLPGQVHTYFGGSEQHILQAYKHEVNDAVGKSNIEINDKIEDILKGLGIKVGRQNYTYHAAGTEHSGENVYGILQAPRGDATEAIVLVAPWESIERLPNRNGVALALTMARYFKRWSLWSKDIIILFPPDSRTGTQAWVDAYHDAHNPQYVTPLPLKSGALQGALALDFPVDQRFAALQVIYDGVNGQLPNLDLVNSVGNIASGQMGIRSFIQGNRHHNGRYRHRLETMLRGMLKQAVGYAAGAHSSFIPYHVDAVTVQPYGKGLHDEMAMGRVIEGSFRSLNNLLEHLHQSFFFYLLLQRERFVSIGTYLPSAMLLAANFSIMAISLWVKSGQAVESKHGKGGKPTNTKGGASKSSSERSIALPMAVVAACHALATVPLFLFNHLPANALYAAFVAFSVISTALPFVISTFLGSVYAFNAQSYQLVKSFSLLILGVALSTLATLNFSLAFVVGVLTAPLSFVRPTGHPALKAAMGVVLCAVAPPTVIYGASLWAGIDVGHILEEASFGWNVWGMYTPIIVWGIWWPAWTLGMISILGST